MWGRGGCVEGDCGGEEVGGWRDRALGVEEMIPCLGNALHGIA